MTTWGFTLNTTLEFKLIAGTPLSGAKEVIGTLEPHVGIHIGCWNTTLIGRTPLQFKAQKRL